MRGHPGYPGNGGEPSSAYSGSEPCQAAEGLTLRPPSVLAAALCRSAWYSPVLYKGSKLILMQVSDLPKAPGSPMILT